MAKSETGVEVLTPDSPGADNRIYGPGRRDRYSVIRGRLAHPDIIVQKFGGWEGVAVYPKIRRNHAWLDGLCTQRVDRIMAIERRIVPGDPGEKVSVEMADDFRRFWNRIPRKDSVLQKVVDDGLFCGVSTTEKVLGRDDVTGLIGPTRLFSLPPQAVKFGEDEDEIFFCSTTNPDGELVDNPKKFMIFRWGDTFTPYGESELIPCYVPAWYIEKILEFGLEAVEDFGKPTAWVKIPALYQPDEWNKVISAVRANHKNFIATPFDGTSPDVSFPTVNVTSSGTAGRAESEMIRLLQGWCSIAILGTQQTGEKNYGSQSMEETRDARTDSKTPPASDALDEILTEHIADEVSFLNWPDQPRELWPRFDSEPEPVENLDAKHKWVMEAVDRNIDVSPEWYFGQFGIDRRKKEEDRLGEPSTTRTVTEATTKTVETEKKKHEPEDDPETVKGGEAA